MATTCSNCNSPLASDDRFCGECGAPVQVAPEALQVNVEETAILEAAASEPSDPPPVSEPVKKTFGSFSRKGILLFGSYVAVAGILYFVTRETPYSGRPQAVSAPIPQASPDNSTSSKTKAPSAVAPGPSGSDTVNRNINLVRTVYRTNGIEGVAPYQLTVPSCGACIPFMIYCNSKISSVSDLGGKKVRVRTDEADQLVRSVGGGPQLLSLPDTMRALEQNIIQCAIAGGDVPEQ